MCRDLEIKAEHAALTAKKQLTVNATVLTHWRETELTQR